MKVPPIPSIGDASSDKDPATIDVTPCELPKETYVFPSDVSLQFVRGYSRVPGIPDLIPQKSGSDGDKRPSMQDGRPFRFIPKLSNEHLKKMEDNQSISCTILKFVKVPVPGYGVVITICTPSSLDWKEFYEVSILDYPSCSCPNFKFMKVRTNRKRKWMLCKHLYFLL